MEEKLDMILSQLGTMGADIKEIKEDVGVLKEDVGVLKEEVRILKEDMAEVKEEIRILKEEVAKLKEDVNILKKDVAILKEDVNKLYVEVDVLKEKMRDIQLTFENETNRNIRVIAENHLDLHRKMDDVLKGDGERELLMLRMNIMEDDMRKVKVHIGLPA